MITKNKRGVIDLIGIKFEENSYPCLRCIYLIQATRINEESSGEYDLHVNCAISGCPKGESQKKNNCINIKKTEAYIKISNCIEMLKRCLELKSKGRDGIE